MSPLSYYLAPKELFRGRLGPRGCRTFEDWVGLAKTESLLLLTENGKNHTTIGSALLGIEPNMSNITPPRDRTDRSPPPDSGLGNISLHKSMRRTEFEPEPSLYRSTRINPRLTALSENEKNHTTIKSALLRIEPNISNIIPPR